MKYQTAALREALASSLGILFSGVVATAESSIHVEGAWIRELSAVPE